MPPLDSNSVATALVLFGTRPEAIKLAPVVSALRSLPGIKVCAVNTGQHAELLDPFLKWFDLRADYSLKTLVPGQGLNSLFARILQAVDPILESVRPSVVVVQGDTTSALAGALAAFHRRIPVAHVEAGLRSGDPNSPFPEELNRRLASQLARWHFAAHANHAEQLKREGVPSSNIHITGNPVVDALQTVLKNRPQSELVKKLLERTAGLKRIALTTHRRESFGEKMEQYLRTIRSFVERQPDTAAIFPMHPNPIVREQAYSILAERERIVLCDPLDYPDFLGLLSNSWAIASDSGGVQEEAPSLGVPLFILRENTERPEVLDTGLAALCPTADDLWNGLTELHRNPVKHRPRDNPFGDGRAAMRIAKILQRELLGREVTNRERVA